MSGIAPRQKGSFFDPLMNPEAAAPAPTVEPTFQPAMKSTASLSSSIAAALEDEVPVQSMHEFLGIADDSTVHAAKSKLFSDDASDDEDDVTKERKAARRAQLDAEAQRSEAARQAAAASTTTPSVAVTSSRPAHLASTGVKSNNLFRDEDGGDEDSARIGAAKGLAGVFIPAGAAEYHTDETRHASEAIDEKLLSAGASGDDLDKLADLNISAKPAAVSIAAPQAATSASAVPEVDDLDDLFSFSSTAAKPLQTVDANAPDFDFASYVKQNAASSSGNTTTTTKGASLFDDDD